jgi:hypothetical protein
LWKKIIRIKLVNNCKITNHVQPIIKVLPLFPNQQIFCHNFVLVLAYYGKLSPQHGQDFLEVASELISVAAVSLRESLTCKQMSKTQNVKQNKDSMLLHNIYIKHFASDKKSLKEKKDFRPKALNLVSVGCATMFRL